MSWSPQQDAALQAVAAWLKDGGQQVFRLFGFAGTGKTTLAKEIAAGVKGKVLFGAFTGKAALVLRTKGCKGASTIHSLMYKPRGEKDGVLRFKLDEKSDVHDAELLIIDECSMVDEELGADLLSFGTPILVLGDPAQLPPVTGAGFFTSAEPDVMLSEVHRQARDNPIIRMAMTVREGGRLEAGSYGESRVLSRRALERAQVMEAEQVLVGLNRTRRTYNARVREHLGLDPAGPMVGDKLVCLRNKHEKGLLNGGLWTVDEVGKVTTASVRMSLSAQEAGTTQHARVTVRREFFDGRETELDRRVRRDSDEFDYGYVLTAHKAQGSQWNDVVVFDESGAFRDQRGRWLYTAITRAAERVTVVT